MNALQVLIGMIVIRVILPVGILLAIGEWASRQAHKHTDHWARGL